MGSLATQNQNSSMLKNIVYKGFCSLHRHKDHLVRKRKRFLFQNLWIWGSSDKQTLVNKNLKPLIDIWKNKQNYCS